MTAPQIVVKKGEPCPQKFPSMLSNKSLKDVFTSGKYPFPYKPEKFTRSEKAVLGNFFTNVDKPVFAIHNLPQEVVGAMFSRYSRTAKSVRRLFLDEFWSANELKLKANTGATKYKKALERTQDFYKRVFAEYGDDSVIQMGSVHIAFEFISQLIGAKGVEDQRVAASYIEKSTRYVDFGAKVNGHYLYMEPVEITSSRLKKDFITWNEELFDAYTRHFQSVSDYLRTIYKLEDQEVEDTKTGKLVAFNRLSAVDRELVTLAYNRALKAKALDTIRFFLPLTTVTNLGAHFSGQAAELTINKMLASPFDEVRFWGVMAYEELMKVVPNFLQNVGHHFGQTARNYRRESMVKTVDIASRYARKIKSKGGLSKLATLINYDKDADVKIASEIIFAGSPHVLSKKGILAWARAVKRAEGQKWSKTLLGVIKDAVPDRKLVGRSRRQKLPRAFEHVFVEIEFCTDIGAYKDLQRNRLSSTQRQVFNVGEVYIPSEYRAPALAGVLKDYLRLAQKTRKLRTRLSKIKAVGAAPEYVGIMGNKVNFNVKANLRQWCFFAELRTISGGHPTYRAALQEAARLIISVMPFMKDYFTHVDWVDDYGLGRLKAEIHTQQKLARLK